MKVKKVIVILIVLIFILNISKCYASTDNLDISAESAILIDSSSERVLYSKNENEKMYCHSTWKRHGGNYCESVYISGGERDQYFRYLSDDRARIF